MDEKVFSKVVVTEQEISEYFNSHHNEFNQGERVVIRQIVLATEKEANEINYKVTKNNFEALARKHSISPESENGGLIGPFARQEMPPEFDIAFTMRPGEIKGVMKSSYGFHIIKLERLMPKVKQSLSDATSRIKDILLKKKREEEYRKWVELALNVIPVRGPKPL
jgi:peptidyl-prolyl cis-trans isomerase C